jgi:hypothetical protein
MQPGASVILAGRHLLGSTITIGGIEVPVEDLSSREGFLDNSVLDETHSFDLIRIRVPEGVSSGRVRVQSETDGATELAAVSPWWTPQVLESSIEARFDPSIPVFVAGQPIPLGSNLSDGSWNSLDYFGDAGWKARRAPFESEIVTEKSGNETFVQGQKLTNSVSFVRQANADLYHLIFISPEAAKLRIHEPLYTRPEGLQLAFGDTLFSGPLRIEFGEDLVPIDFTGVRRIQLSNTPSPLRELPEITVRPNYFGPTHWAEVGDYLSIGFDQVDIDEFLNQTITIASPWARQTIRLADLTE